MVRPPVGERCSTFSFRYKHKWTEFPPLRKWQKAPCTVRKCNRTGWIAGVIFTESYRETGKIAEQSGRCHHPIVNCLLARYRHRRFRNRSSIYPHLSALPHRPRHAVYACAALLCSLARLHLCHTSRYVYTRAPNARSLTRAAVSHLVTRSISAPERNSELNGKSLLWSVFVSLNARFDPNERPVAAYLKAVNGYREPVARNIVPQVYKENPESSHLCVHPFRILRITKHAPSTPLLPTIDRFDVLRDVSTTRTMTQNRRFPRRSH